MHATPHPSSPLRQPSPTAAWCQAATAALRRWPDALPAPLAARWKTAALPASRPAAAHPLPSGDSTRLPLPCGRQAVVRRACAEDSLLAPAFLQGLSPRTQRRRFQGRLPALGAQALASPLASSTRQQALVATLQHGDSEQLVGDARFVMEGDGRDAEFAIVVSDTLRRRGLGRALMLGLTQAASDAGVRWLRGEVHDDNPAMLALMLNLGFAPARRDDAAGLLVFEQRLR